MSDSVQPPWLDELQLKFAQEADTCAESRDVQVLDVLVTRGDSAGAFYYCLSTERWAVDDETELVALFARIQAAVAAAAAVKAELVATKPAGKPRTTKAP